MAIGCVRSPGPASSSIKQARLRAYQAVNTELVGLYWQIGEYISGKLAAAGWGEGVVDSHRRSIWLCERRSGPI